MVQIIHVGNVQLTGKIARRGKKNHFAKKCRSNKGQGQTQGNGSAKKSFKYREVNVDQESSDDGQIDEITSRVTSCNGNSMKTHFKVDTGADGNLLPLGEFFKHFPEANLNNLAKMVAPHTKLYAYNNTEIKQLGVCELIVE